MSQYPDCSICQDIWRFFSDPASCTSNVNLGSFDNALASPCSRHTPLIRAFRDHCASGDYIREADDDVGFVKSNNNESKAYLSQSVTKLGAYWNLLLIKKDNVPNHIGTGRILDPGWADIEIAKRWKAECLLSHGAKCHNPLKVWSTQPAWLIDVEKECIVPGTECGDFVALSYRRGDGVGFTMTDDLVDQLRQPGGLKTPEISARLPPVVHRAMQLTSHLGERYLWADAVCIIRGNYTSTDQQLSLMGIIYANAVLTIIAADDDSQGALSGLKDISPPRELEQQVIQFGDEKLIVRNTQIFSLEHGTPYYERGWTYQELKLSTRKLLFNQRELHWQCQCSVWHEETILGTEVDKYIDPRLAIIAAGFPDLGALSHAISSYNSRELRYDEDALPGLFGLLSVASRSFTGGFLYGLPEMFFERGLGWKPFWRHTNLRRRKPSGRSAESQLSPALSALPSWSWVGWQGLVDLSTYGEAARINSRENKIEETTPITEWYTSSRPSGAPKRRIRPTWLENRDAWKDFSRPLPEGWSAHPAPETGFRGEPHLFPDGCGERIFRHARMPEKGEFGDDGWYYPFPVADIDVSTAPSMPEQTAYLFCETKGARLWGAWGPERDENDYEFQNLIELRSAGGDKVGSLHLHNEEQRSLFPEGSKESEVGTPVDLVAIYKSRRYSKTWHPEEKRMGLPLEIKDVYVVLWVEWKDGVAYRLASGHVEKEDWEALEPADVSLVLG